MSRLRVEPDPVSPIESDAGGHHEAHYHGGIADDIRMSSISSYTAGAGREQPEQQPLTPVNDSDQDNSYNSNYASHTNINIVPRNFNHEHKAAGFGPDNIIQQTPITPLHRRAPSVWEKTTEKWTWEVAATIASLLCQGAIVAVLAVYQGRPLEEWTFFFSINTVLATLIAAEKSFMLFAVASCLGQLKWVYFKTKNSPRPLHHFGYFDDAAKGPLGALRVVFSFKVRWGIAWVGALVVVLSVAVDPFAQQVLSFPTREVVVDDVGGVSFGYTHNYTFGAEVDPQQIGKMGTEEKMYPWILGETVDGGMIGTITAGLYNITAPPKYNCTSKCLWKQAYVSLGFESICENVTQATMATEKCSGEPDGTGRMECNMTTPGNITLQTHLGLEDGFTALVVGTKRLDYGVVRDGDGLDGVGVSPRFTRLAVLNGMEPVNFGFEEAHLAGHSVHECELGLAAWRYSNVSATGSNFTVGTNEKIPIETNGTYVKVDGNFTGMIQNYDEIKFTLPSGDNMPELTIRAADFGALGDFLSREPFTGTITNMLSRGSPGIRSGLLKADVPAVFDTVAKSMTDYIRSGPSSSLARGSRIDGVVFIHVEWGWLALPILSAVAAALLLVVTMYASARLKGLSLWKDSTTPLLFTHYNVQDGSLNTQMAQPRDVKAFAESVRATIR
ncbi:hypothetical protein B0H66DRAFT_594797 [Apodospora peruviana]|uniref:Uncharacterized protein n=1 Tax=Apodospora peruviana TaxID=516989 RepID=A0AAE0HW32_9PEZI|nr:hypothetical protein B0H66DRAFT_594797 [Apodospora peruviana]